MGSEGLSVDNLMKLRDIAESPGSLRLAGKEFSIERAIELDAMPYLVMVTQEYWDAWLDYKGFDKNHEKKFEKFNGRDVVVVILPEHDQETNNNDSRKATKKFYMDLNMKYNKSESQTKKNKK